NTFQATATGMVVRSKATTGASTPPPPMRRNKTISMSPTAIRLPSDVTIKVASSGSFTDGLLSSCGRRRLATEASRRRPPQSSLNGEDSVAKAALRIGQLLGPGQRTDLEPSQDGEGSLHYQERYRFRLLTRYEAAVGLAGHPPTWPFCSSALPGRVVR